MNHFIIVAIGEDRPGIVAKVTEILFKNGFNIEDSSMTRLNNEFTIMLIVKGDKSLEHLKQEFSQLEKEGLTIIIKEVSEDVINKPRKKLPIFNIAVYGSDKPGIVYKVSKLLADKGINISDLRTEKVNSLYIMFIESEFPEEVNILEFNREIEKLKQELDVDIEIENVETAEL
ncbi:MAG TPA: ACT domain-containing protein [Sulfurihydrogenibium sp.]|uniref:glycine cleavage system protein R n=1 Tax=Sulfurihydrogenibium sp. (strain YO3AOP1) TaxID=436114 RepID=UPI00017232D3|nr:ACT domain-containing protein [Sulfurihydrogenibium sp. YO3AOP1]ACD66524.1 amino acid-binding ACT domain protein [Sulfurihydrogenibium sp. YO3AOP1]HBT98383.1 ACT domain-containing protein [Sulfurihydrogenibium sp.]